MGRPSLLKGTSDCLVAGNTIHNVGDYDGNGVTVDGGTRNGVAGNDVFAIGSNGIAISGGDRLTLTPAGNYADNNYIHHTGVYYKQGVGILLNGVGNRATHNLIHDCPRHGILFYGNNLAIEFNHIRHVSLETSDTGALYTGGARLDFFPRHAASATTTSTTCSATAARTTAVGSRPTIPGASTSTTARPASM